MVLKGLVVDKKTTFGPRGRTFFTHQINVSGFHTRLTLTSHNALHFHIMSQLYCQHSHYCNVHGRNNYFESAHCIWANHHLDLFFVLCVS